jgi:ribosomal protein L7/L12
MKFTLTLVEVQKMIRAKYDLPSDVTIEVEGFNVDANEAAAVRLQKALENVPVWNGGLDRGIENVFDAGGNIRPDRKITAIQALRTELSAHGLGLAEAKQVIENWHRFMAYVRVNGLPVNFSTWM